MRSLLERISRRLSHMLRHAPEDYGVELSEDGWVGVDDALRALCESGLEADVETIEAILEHSDKRRFELDREAGRVRAVHGHSVDVEIGLPDVTPPGQLYHGTVQRFLESIRREGLRRGTRLSVHLAASPDEARKVGGRRGEPLVLVIDSARMAADGHAFQRSESGVWLTAEVPVVYIRFP